MNTRENVCLHVCMFASMAITELYPIKAMPVELGSGSFEDSGRLI